MFAVTLFHFPPPSRVYHSWPSFVPAQIRPFCTGEGAIAKTTSP